MSSSYLCLNLLMLRQCCYLRINYAPALSDNVRVFGRLNFGKSICEEKETDVMFQRGRERERDGYSTHLLLI